MLSYSDHITVVHICNWLNLVSCVGMVAPPSLSEGCSIKLFLETSTPWNLYLYILLLCHPNHDSFGMCARNLQPITFRMIHLMQWIHYVTKCADLVCKLHVPRHTSIVRAASTGRIISKLTLPLQSEGIVTVQEIIHDRHITMCRS
jgi:hypothetical protein